ncbi:MAG: TIM barrel protein [Candidatus Lernaella stagnicola]|nr:TIM barrel protein [Candidatus Lernaella stagnicola]
MALVDLRRQATRRSPDQLVAQLNSFELDLKFSAGIWCFSPPGNRFHDKYKPEIDIEQRLEIAAGLADSGLVGLEAHYPNEINENNLDLWKKFCADTGIRLVTVVPLLFHEAQFEFGSLSSPLPNARRAAIQRAVEAFQLNRELDTDFAVVWAGIDGFENPFGIDFPAARDRFAEALAVALDAVPGCRVAFEPKPYEPRGRQFYGTTPEGLLLGFKIERMLAHQANHKLMREGHSLVCLNPEIGHMLMAYEDLAYSFSQVLEYGRLAHIHVNSQPLGNFDQDLNVGVVSPEQLEAALYVLKMHGYQGYFGIDINPERQPIEQAIRNSIDAIRAANDRINEYDHEAVIWATMNPHRDRGWLEAYLIRQRAPYPDRLPPLPNPRRE